MDTTLVRTKPPLREIEAFVASFDEGSAMAGRIADNHSDPLRFVWLGSSPSHWVCLAWREENFDVRVLEAFDAKGITSFPWACAPAVLDALVELAFVQCPGLRVHNMAHTEAGLRRQDKTNRLPFSRLRNYASYFVIWPDALVCAARLLLREMPGSWLYSSQGFDTALAPGNEPRLGGRIELLSMDDYFHEASFQVHYIHHIDCLTPLSLIDGLQQGWALWIPAAARVLGAPAALSTSLIGLHSLLGIKDIAQAVKTEATERPVEFIRTFAEAISPLKPDFFRSSLLDETTKASLALARSTFIDADRKAALREVLGSDASPLDSGKAIRLYAVMRSTHESSP